MPSFIGLDRARARSDRERTRGCREHNVFAFVLLAMLVGCEAAPASGSDPIASEQSIGDQEPSGDPPASSSARAPSANASGEGDPSGPATGGAPAPPLASDLLAKMKSCTAVSSSPYAKSSGASATVDVCGLKNAVYWNADLDVDCDGKSSTACSSATDPWYQSETAASDSKGDPLDAAELPYVVVPGVSSRWSYKSAGIAMGSVVAVIYDGKVEYGIVGDVGPTGAIGEASYAMAKRLGIDPNPKTGGIGSGVTYLVFTGTSGVVTKKEDHSEATAIGVARAKQFLAEN